MTAIIIRSSTRGIYVRASNDAAGRTQAFAIATAHFGRPAGGAALQDAKNGEVTYRFNV